MELEELKTAHEVWERAREVHRRIVAQRVRKVRDLSHSLEELERVRREKEEAEKAAVSKQTETARAESEQRLGEKIRIAKQKWNTYSNMRLKIANVCRLLEEYYGPSIVNKKTIEGESRTHPIVHARQEAAWLMRAAYQWSFPRIGSKLGERDHTTILHAIRTVDEKRKRDNDMKKRLDIMLQELKRADEQVYNQIDAGIGGDQ